jgi:hypothetical protein
LTFPPDGWPCNKGSFLYLSNIFGFDGPSNFLSTLIRFFVYFLKEKLKNLKNKNKINYYIIKARFFIIYNVWPKEYLNLILLNFMNHNVKIIKNLIKKILYK